MLLRAKHNLAAFAFPNGHWQEDYEAQYEGFQQLCAAHGREWDALDINFVFCVPKPETGFETFCSRVETDVYFCRKFVVPLNVTMPAALARLPFLPLDPLQGAGLRPDSASVYLQRHGVSPLLARYLSQMHQKGVEEIVNGCLADDYGEPRLTAALARVAETPADRQLVPVRIEQVEIENFRAYRQRKVFKIARDVTIIYGPNGFGKTSFFDAIDFAVTGGIGRLEALTETQFLKAATHLDSEPAQSVVALTVDGADGKKRIERIVKTHNQATLDGERKDRKSILAALTAAGAVGTERIDHLVRLFRATHQFNQEVQELTKEFQKDCRLSADIVSRMLAFEDYNNAVAKAGKVHTHIQGLVAAEDQAILSAETQAAINRQELQRLSASVKSLGSPATLEEGIAQLRTKMTTAGLETGDGSVDAAVLRGWRASIAVLLGESASRIARLTELAKDLPLRSETLSKLKNATQELAARTATQATAEKEKSEAELGSQQATRLATDANTRLKEAVARSQELEWIRATKPRYTEALAQEAKLVTELNTLASFVAAQRTVEEKLVVELRTVETAVTQRAEKSAALQKRIAVLTRLSDGLSDHSERSKRLAIVEDAKRSLENRSAELLPRMRQTEKDQAPLQAEEKRVQDLIDQTSAQASDLKRLLGELSGHVHTGVCPICAADYGAKEQLLQRMQHHIRSADASQLHEQLRLAREKIADSKRLATALATERAQLTRQANDANAEKNTLEKACAAFAKALEDAGFFPNLPEGQIADNLRDALGKLQAEVTQLGKPLAEDAKLPSLRETLATNRRETEGKRIDQEEKNKTLAERRAEVARLRADARAKGGALDMPDDQLSAAIQAAQAAVIAARDHHATLDAEAAKLRAALVPLRQALTLVSSEVANLRNQIAHQNKWLADFDARLAAAAMPADLSSEALAEKLRTESAAQATFPLLNDEATNLEIALDAATTAAALSRLTENIHAADKMKAAAEARRAKFLPWVDYFSQLSELLGAQQASAIAKFTVEYGPRASVIQRRLRSVYGFDDITLTSEGSDIIVRATRRGEPLKPTDYFSQSQQQTLLLALFLTACSSQTWSGFCPVLLDDPVTHFDDLNTYAFLDLVAGLVESQSGPRQFIVSTCDERLYQLARQKFRHLGTRAAFYTFLSSGKDGPEIEAADTN